MELPLAPSSAAGAPGGSNVRVLSPEQLRRLATVHRHATRSLAPGELLRTLALRISEIVEAKAAFVGRRSGAWVVLGEAPGTPLPFASPDAVPGSFDRAAADLGAAVKAWQHQRQDWTLVGLTKSPDPQVVLLLEGDWTRSVSGLQDLARTLITGSSNVTQPPPAAAIASHSLTCALADVSGLREVSELVLRHVVAAVPSRLGAIALPISRDELSVVATHGYPLTLVEHLRIAPGSGVIGAVYESGAPMVVADVGEVPGIRHRRPRYRTNSFVAMPITAASEVLAVVCLTDRTGDGPFTQEQVTALRALVAPAALAFGRERAQRQARAYAQAAIVDPLTGLFNRRYFEARLEQELQRASRQGTSMALLMIDIDHFKRVNDTFGHVAGDTVIRDLARILRGSVRAFDVCARYGGEEFSVVMPGSDAGSALLIAERIRQRIATYRPSELALTDLRITVSLGVAVSPRGAGTREVSVRAFIERADRALYAAKRAGSNRVTTSTEGE